MKYICIVPDSDLPPFPTDNPSKVILINESKTTNEWRKIVSDWLTKSGCLYLMAYGKDCGNWEARVDMSNIEDFDFGEIPDENFVMTTSHEDEPLSNVFNFCKENARHPTIPNLEAVCVHIKGKSKLDNNKYIRKLCSNDKD